MLQHLRKTWMMRLDKARTRARKRKERVPKKKDNGHLARKKRREPTVLDNVRVTDAGSKGKNIARAGNFVVLVDNAVPGDLIDVKVFRKKKGFGEGSAIHFHEYSPDRVIPVCPHFDHCGGCNWQNMTYEKQLFFKQKAVTDALERIGKLELPPIEPIAGSHRTEYYRNRLDFAFSRKRWLSPAEMETLELGSEQPGLGFHVSGRFDKVLDLGRCYLQPDPSNRIRLAVRQWALDHDYAFFDLREQKGSLRSLIVRTTLSGELMVIVIFYQESQERIETLMNFLLERFPQISSLYYVVNPKANDSVYDLEHHLFHGDSFLREKLNGISYRIGPKSFFQTNPGQAELLFAKTKALADVQPHETVYDLYTGVGSIALYLADSALKVIGIETVEEAIEYAKANAEDNRISNAEFFAGDVKDILTDEFIAEKGRPDVLITDPPRTGMEPAVVNKILELLPQRIVYVSCNAATQARDLEMMKTHYDILKVQPVDMFPHTYHVENIVLMKRRETEA
jgi:23S rRNA (uracil1939-C5)-methyltransferase